ncbi:RagB/SusD family nutrient uptake outer membrane protein [Allomuricauda sp. SCSIO 65647]|uniref:RagB/SusD family nutrient uptake outer membrane protein n=1 Tax=Allomuricauda sp. SCSIO 65647 TaxID=2908843 RepID=UPI001F47AA37|nr:RagB/SusD family nutrient uptake outer membrane protein [Muricauda sp. SCSIO 65647]UJH67850.1 RagB/SusD family nutrient uptake outer membrane protein [Muricauda sp. SCSIO 65647]
MRTKTLLIISLLLTGFLYHSCSDLEAEVHSEITPESFYQTDVQLAAAAAAAYTPLYGYWGLFEEQDITTDQSTCPIRTNGGWNDGGLWPRLMRHEFNERDFVNGEWTKWFGGVASCNRLIEIFEANVGEDAPIISELRALRAFYYFKLLDLFGNVPIETEFAEADAAPSQSSPSEVFTFIEQELIESIPNLREEKNIETYGKMNKWAAYTLLADLYINAERFDAGPHYQEAAGAANEVINSGAYSLESGYFKNFRVENEDSNENIFVVPYDKNNARGLVIWSGALNQSARPTYGLVGQPWGGFSIQEDFYNAFDENDKRRGMFIVGQQYTGEAQPIWTDTDGFFYNNPQPEFELVDCTEDFNRALPEELEEKPIDCNIFITPEISLTSARGIAYYREGARYGKYEIELNSGQRNYSNDFAIYRFAHVLLMRAEGLWRQDNGSAEALNLVNQVRARAGLDALTVLSEDDLYWELKKELAMENHARPITIRFGHWEDAWFLKEANPGELFKRFYPIPQLQLQSNVNLVQNPGY